MAETQSIDVVLDEAKPNGFVMGVWALCAAVLLMDGYDLTVISFMAPEFVKEFGFEKSSLGVVFATSLVGVAIGGPLGGWLGDKFGRRFVLIVSCFIFGLATLAMLPSNSIAQFALCRFVVGLGLGGALSASIALTAEYSPKISRNRILALVGTAVPLGAVIPGILTAALVPTQGWQILAIIGGVVPVLLGVLLWWKIPESPKYLALRPERHDRLAEVLKRMGQSGEWDRALSPTPAKKGSNGSPKLLLGDGMAGITPLLWVLFFANSMALYLVFSWLPLVLQSLGMTIEEAGKISAIFASAGFLGGLTIVALVKRLGVALVPALFIVAIPFLLLFSAMELPKHLIILVVAVPGLAVGGIPVACTALAGMLYPTEVRASGIGWAISMGRVGAILGPLVGGAVFALNLPPQKTFAFAAAPMALGAVASIIMTVLCFRRFGGLQVDDKKQNS